MNDSSTMIHRAFFVAYEEAIKAKKNNEVPVGACIVFNEEIISSAHNCIKQKSDPTAHAELEAIRLASQKLNNERLVGTKLFSTLEPCSLCSGGIILARIEEVHFLSFEKRIPAFRQILTLQHHNHIPKWKQHTIDNFPASTLLRNFFKEKRALDRT